METPLHGRLTQPWRHARPRRIWLAAALLCAGCAGRPAPPPDAEASSSRAARPRPGHVRPGITVLLDDSIGLVRGRRLGLLTNQTGVDEHGTSDIELLRDDTRARRAGVRLVALFSPEHGIRGTEDREQIVDTVDLRTGLPVYSLYGRTTVAPPDSVLRRLDALVIDLQDVGTRTWTYGAATVYSMRAAARARIPVVVLDRPNPIGGEHVEGPMLDSSLANPQDNSPSRPARPYALYPLPLRHGMTAGELARFYNGSLQLGADLHVVTADGWGRTMWFDQTGLPWIRPSPNLPSLTSALLYPALVAFEGSNLSVGRGTPEAFQRLGAPWLRAEETVALLRDRELPGVGFEVERFTPHGPTDRKYGERSVPGIRILVRDRDHVQSSRLGAALLWAVARVNPDSLRLDTTAFDLRFGSAQARQALVRGEDPDAVVDHDLPAVIAFRRVARGYELYR